MMNRVVKIMQWNACTWNYSRQLQVRERVNNDCIDVIVITEARLSEPSKLFNDFKCYGNSMLHVYVKKTIEFEIVGELCRVDGDGGGGGGHNNHVVTIRFKDWIMIAAYFASGRHVHGVNMLKQVYGDALNYSKQICLVGDFNAKLPSWHGISNTAGRHLSRFIDESSEGLIVMNEFNEHTFSRPHCRKSILDLYICKESDEESG